MTRTRMRPHSPLQLHAIAGAPEAKKETAKNQSWAILAGVCNMSTENKQPSFKKAWASALC